MNKPAAPVVPFVVARVFAIVLTSTIFSVLLTVLGFVVCRGLVDPALGVLPARSIGLAMAVISVFVPFFAAQGISFGLLDGYAQGRFHLPPGAAAVGAGAKLANPWLVGAIASTALGAPCALVLAALATSLWPSGLPLSAFVTRLVALGALLALATTLPLSGKRFLRDVNMARETRRFPGTPAQYTWFRHVLPQSLANLVINAWVAVPLFPHPIFEAGATVPIALVIGDTFVSTFVIALAVWTGVMPHATFDLRWGVISPLPRPAKPKTMQAAMLLAASVAVTVLAYGAFTTAGVSGLGFWPFVAWRAILCGTYAAWTAYVSAEWTLAEG